MDVERIVFRLIADASSYFNVLDSAQSRLLFFASFMTEHMGRAALQMAAEFEQAAISFEVMTGSAELAYSILKDISDLALRTPFSFSELVASAKQVKAFGFDVADITTVLSRLGDVSAGTGVDINRIILAFGQVRTTGRLMGQELRQFANAGIPILDYLARVMGRSVSQIPQLVRQGRVSFATVSAAFNEMTKEGGLFGGMMERVTAETLGGRWQNFVESFKLATRDMGLMVVEVFKLRDVLTSLSDFFQGVNTKDNIGVWRERLETVRAGFLLLWRTGVAAWEGIKTGAEGVWAFAVQFYAQHRQLLNILLGIVATYKALQLAAWAWGAATLAVYSILKGINGVLLAIHLGLKAIATVKGFLLLLMQGYSILLAIKSLAIGLGTIFTLLLNPVGLVVVGLAALTAAVLRDGELIGKTFEAIQASLGRMFGVMVELGPEFKKTWDAVVAAVRGGDLETAFELAIAGVKVAWRGLTEVMKREWETFTEIFGATLDKKVYENTFKPIQEGLADLYESIGATERAAQARERIRRSMLAFEDRARAANERADRDNNPAAVAAFIRGLPEFRQMQDLRARAALIGQIGKDMEQASREMGQRLFGPPDARGERAYLGVPQLDLDAVAASIGGPIAAGLQNEYSRLYRAFLADVANVRNLTRMQSLGEQAQFPGGVRRVPEAGDIEAAGQRARTAWQELNKFTEAVTANGRAAAEARRRLPEPLEVSIGAQRAAQELERIFAEGVGPLDKFRRSVANIEEAFAGPIPEALMGVLPAAAVMGVRTFGGLINEKMRDEGLFRAYEEFRRSLPNEVERRPGAFLAGSREAQEVINRAQGQTTDVQQQIKAEIQLGNHLAQEAARHRAQVVAALRDLAVQGGGVVGRRVDGGGND